MLNFARGAVISVALVLVSWWALQGSPSFQSCIQQDQKQTAENKPENYLSAFAAGADRYRDCLGDFVHDRKDEILVAFTVILAFSTIFLWVATRDLVSGAEKAAKSQLRAYVGLAEIKIANCNAGQIPQLTFRIVNYGQTPAYDVHYVHWLAVGEQWGRQSVADLGTINPGQERYFQRERKALLTEEEFTGIMDDTSPIFTAGTVHYRDAFGRKQSSTFEYETSSKLIKGERRLMLSKKGNHST
jgi:hypothetical protein